MSEQAIETDENEDFQIVAEPEDEVVEETDEQETDAPEVEEGEEVESEPETEIAAESETDEEVEVVFEGEDEPTSKPVRGVRRLVKRLGEAKAETDQERKQREALEEENKLLRMKILQQQNVTEAEPNADDFDTDAEYQAALKDHFKREARKAAQEETARLISETRQQTTQAQKSAARSSQLDEHYKRVDSSGIKGYDELEGTAIEIMGQDLVEEIAANNDKGHLIIAHLGVNVGKAEKYARMARENPVRTLLEIGALANELKVQRKRSRPASPETRIDKGLATSEKSDDRGTRYF